MLPAELALTKTLLDIAVSSDSFESPDLSIEVARVFQRLDDEEATAAPQALANTIAASAGDLFRWRSLVDVAVRFDTFEVLPAAIGTLDRVADPQQIAALATLATNPGVPSQDRRTLEDFIARADLKSRMASIIELRLGHRTPVSDLEIVLDQQVWPGRYSSRQLRNVSPLVYLGSEGVPPSEILKVAAAVVEAGGRVRRVPNGRFTLKQPQWASAEYPLVAWSGVTISRWREATRMKQSRAVTPGGDLDQPIVLARLVNQIEALMPEGVRFARHSPELSLSPGAAFAPELLDEGAFDAMELSFLGGASRSTIQRMAREVEVLSAGDHGVWKFDQLITIRLVQAFKAQSKRFKATASLVGKLREIAAASQKSEVGIDSLGKLYVESDGQFVSAEGGQPALSDEVLSVDDAFRTFAVGGGQVPNLLLPSRYTSVNPLVLAGTPTVRDRRIPARSVAEFVAVRGDLALRSAFPELQPGEAQDAVIIGNQILARKS